MTAMHQGAAHSKGRRTKEVGPKAASAASERLLRDSDLLTVTIQAKTGRIVRVEDTGGAGARHELSDEKRAYLRKAIGRDTLESLLEQAFEAGIACVLGGAAGQNEAESEEEADLRHVLLENLIKSSPARRLMQREVLSRAILGTVVRQAISPGSAEAEIGPAKRGPGGSAGRPRHRMSHPAEPISRATRHH